MSSSARMWTLSQSPQFWLYWAMMPSHRLARVLPELTREVGASKMPACKTGYAGLFGTGDRQLAQANGLAV